MTRHIMAYPQSYPRFCPQSHPQSYPQSYHGHPGLGKGHETLVQARPQSEHRTSGTT